jgi:hypothetical protein
MNVVRPRRSRLKEGQLLSQFAQSTASERQFAAANGVPRTTMQGWRHRAMAIPLPTATVNFFESEHGQAFLHQLLVAAIYELHERGNASLSAISEFLRRAQLDLFVGASETSLQRMAVELEEAIIAFGRKERDRLAAKMPHKTITVAEDETFFPGTTCLVSIEPVSDYILVECLADDRKSTTWDSATSEALKGLDVTVAQSVSDEGKSIIKHARDSFGAHHSPDLFHIQQELSRGASAQLELRLKRAKEHLAETDQETNAAVEAQKAHEDIEVKPRGRPKDFSAWINTRRQASAEALEAVRRCEKNRAQFRTARKRISELYHPYDLLTGLRRTSDAVGTGLKSAFADIARAAQGLGETFTNRIAKAEKQIGAMTSTVAFYFTVIALYLDNLHLDDRTRSLMETILIPGFYLERMARSTKEKAIRGEIAVAGADLLADFRARAGPFALYSKEKLEELGMHARECANRFHRSSSCTEGRNGQLSLHHHNLHAISGRRLAALTVIHNFDTYRADGSTPASRFFVAAHYLLFHALRETVSPPKRPRQRHAATVLGGRN